MKRIAFKCSYCSQRLIASTDMAGTDMECPSCGKKVILPRQKSNIPRAEVDSVAGAGDSERHDDSDSVTKEERLSLPLLLSIFTLFGIVICAFMVIWHTLMLCWAFKQLIESRTTMLVSDVTYESLFVLIFSSALDLLAIVAFVGLRFGKMWAWILVQVPFAWLVIIEIGYIVVSFREGLLHVVIFMLILMIPVILSWVYLYTRSVRSYIWQTR